MAEASITAASPGLLRVEGEMTAASVPQLYRQAAPLLRQSGERVRVDLSAVSRADSAGLALLVEWLAQAAQRGQALEYRSLPAAIEALAGLSEVRAFLAPESEPAT